MVVFEKSGPRFYKVVLTTPGRSQPYYMKRHNPRTSSIVFISEDGASLVHSFTHSSSVHILKEVPIVGGRRRDVHAQSWFIFDVLVLVLELYWKSIIEEFLLGFLPHEALPG